MQVPRITPCQRINKIRYTWILQKYDFSFSFLFIKSIPFSSIPFLHVDNMVGCDFSSWNKNKYKSKIESPQWRQFFFYMFQRNQFNSAEWAAKEQQSFCSHIVISLASFAFTLILRAFLLRVSKFDLFIQFLNKWLSTSSVTLFRKHIVLITIPFGCIAQHIKNRNIQNSTSPCFHM